MGFVVRARSRICLQSAACLAMTMLFCIACDLDLPLSAVNDGQQMTERPAAVTLAQLSALAVRQAAPSEPTPITFPHDLAPHPDAGAESISLRVFLSDEVGSNLGLQVRLDRLALERGRGVNSGWDYTELMRSLITIERAGYSAQRQHQDVQRRALGLADSLSDSLFVLATRLEVDFPNEPDLPGAGQCQADVILTAVLPVGTESAAIASGRIMDTDEQGLQGDTTPLLGQRLELQFALDACPQTFELAGFARWQASALPVKARLWDAHAPGAGGRAATARTAMWTGRAWFSNSWGTLPTPGGPVVIDSAELVLDAPNDDLSQRLSLSRSKRRSGSGPETIQASITDAAGVSRAIDLQWDDAETDRSHTENSTLPQAYRISSEDDSIRLLLIPLVPPGIHTVSDGEAWSGAVVVQGSHRGIGFVDYQPLSTPQAKQQGAIR